MTFLVLIKTGVKIPIIPVELLKVLDKIWLKFKNS